MRKLYNEFFYIPKYGKIREKVMLMRAAITVVIMIICLAAMSFTAYAYFSCSVTSSLNIIKAAHFEADITVTDSNGIRVEPVSKENQTVVFNFTDPGAYTVKLTKGSSTADTGFCIVYFEELKYHTQQIGADIIATDGNRDSVEFQLEIKTTAVIKIESHWGTSSNYSPYSSTNEKEWYIENSEPLKVITVGSMTTSNSEPDEVKIESTETTTSTETNPAEVIHMVVAGENLTVIAEKYNTTIDRIVDYNNLTDADNIQTGLQLKIPISDCQMLANTIEQTTSFIPTEFSNE